MYYSQDFADFLDTVSGSPALIEAVRKGYFITHPLNEGKVTDWVKDHWSPSSRLNNWVRHSRPIAELLSLPITELEKTVTDYELKLLSYYDNKGDIPDRVKNAWRNNDEFVHLSYEDVIKRLPKTNFLIRPGFYLEKPQDMLWNNTVANAGLKAGMAVTILGLSGSLGMCSDAIKTSLHTMENKYDSNSKYQYALEHLDNTIDSLDHYKVNLYNSDVTRIPHDVSASDFVNGAVADMYNANEDPELQSAAQELVYAEAHLSMITKQVSADIKQCAKMDNDDERYKCQNAVSKLQAVKEMDAHLIEANTAFASALTKYVNLLCDKIGPVGFERKETVVKHTTPNKID